MVLDSQYKHALKGAMHGKGDFERDHVEIEAKIHEDGKLEMVTSYVGRPAKQEKHRRGRLIHFLSPSIVRMHW